MSEPRLKLIRLATAAIDDQAKSFDARAHLSGSACESRRALDDRRNEI
jgi:hypothetical protein